MTYISPTTTLSSAQMVKVTATAQADPAQSASLAITVNPQLAISTTQRLADGTVGTAYSQTISLMGGTAPFKWSIYNGPIVTGGNVGGSLPDGLALDPNTGAISGTPTEAGTWYFEAAVSDAVNSDAADGFLSIQINPAAAQAANPVPFLNQPLTPTAVSSGVSSFTLGVSGTGFVSGATVDFNGKPLSTTFVDTEHLTATVSAPDVANVGTAAVTVANPAPGGGVSNVAYLPIAAPETTVSFAAAKLDLQNNLPFGITVGDFNEDGKPDLAVSADSSVFIFAGNGDGTFLSANGSPILVASPSYDDAATPLNTTIVAGDFNHSGHLGLAVEDQPNAAVYILLGNGSGTFSPSSAAFARSATLDGLMVAADLNGDGNLDLALPQPSVLGYGDGAFSAAGNLYASGFPNGLVVGDFNRDGKLDAITASGYIAGPGSSGSGLAVALGRGDGTFTPGPQSPFSLGVNLHAIVAADFNGDGKLDIAVTDSVANTVVILLGNGDGTFGSPLTIPAGRAPVAIVACDFNNDGKLDLALANFGDNTITLLLGNGDGTFTQAMGSPYPVGRGPYAIAAADFNGDGRLDLAVANSTDGTVSILLQH